MTTFHYFLIQKFPGQRFTATEVYNLAPEMNPDDFVRTEADTEWHCYKEFNFEQLAADEQGKEAEELEETVTAIPEEEAKVAVAMPETPVTPVVPAQNSNRNIKWILYIIIALIAICLACLAFIIKGNDSSDTGKTNDSLMGQKALSGNEKQNPDSIAFNIDVPEVRKNNTEEDFDCGDYNEYSENEEDNEEEGYWNYHIKYDFNEVTGMVDNNQIWWLIDAKFTDEGVKCTWAVRNYKKDSTVLYEQREGYIVDLDNNDTYHQKKTTLPDKDLPITLTGDETKMIQATYEPIPRSVHNVSIGAPNSVGQVNINLHIKSKLDPQ